MLSVPSSVSGASALVQIQAGEADLQLAVKHALQMVSRFGVQVGLMQVQTHEKLLVIRETCAVLRVPINVPTRLDGLRIQLACKSGLK